MRIFGFFLGPLERQSTGSVFSALQVSAELQQEVLMSLIQTDPDIIDYLLRRKLRSARLAAALLRTGLGHDWPSFDPVLPSVAVAAT